MADDIEALVWEVRSQDFDRFKHYRWMPEVPLALREMILMNACPLCPAASVNNHIFSVPEWYRVGKFGCGKSEVSNAVTKEKLKELLREYFPSK